MLFSLSKHLSISYPCLKNFDLHSAQELFIQSALAISLYVHLQLFLPPCSFLCVSPSLFYLRLTLPDGFNVSGLGDWF